MIPLKKLIVSCCVFAWNRLFQMIRSGIRVLMTRSPKANNTLTILLAGTVGVLAGVCAALFSISIEWVTHSTLLEAVALGQVTWYGKVVLVACPMVGLFVVSWFTRRYAPEAQGHGVPEVITAVARNNGVIRPQVALVKALASGLCIGTGGSVGREGPIVQIGSALGSTAGQWFGLTTREITVLVAAGAAAGISATFNAPIAGVIFASEIILGSFAVESLTPIVISSVLADVVQQHVGEHRFKPAFQQLDYEFGATWAHLPSYLLLGLVAGLAAVMFTKLLYRVEDFTDAKFPKWWSKALIAGGIVGLAGLFYPATAPLSSPETRHQVAQGEHFAPPLLGVGYGVVEHSLHLVRKDLAPDPGASDLGDLSKTVIVDRSEMMSELFWLMPLLFLKPLLTSVTLAGGGSGGIFAPSLYLGAVLGACFGLVMNIFLPGYSSDPGFYAVVGMGAVVAGTTHGVMSAILIVYEMTENNLIILPIMAAAGLASVVARTIDPESIYYKKLSRRGESLGRSHHLHYLDHVLVRDVMIRKFPTLRHDDDVEEIIRVARANTELECLPVMGEDGKLIGIIRAEDLHRVIDTSISPTLVLASDLALGSPVSSHPQQNLIEALRDFGTRDTEILPVEIGSGENRRLIGLLLRADVMKRYRQEMLASQ